MFFGFYIIQYNGAGLFSCQPEDFRHKIQKRRVEIMSIQKEWLDFMREQYPVGSRIKLRKMGSDDPYPIEPGATGSLQCIDDQGTFHVAWDDGRGLGLVIGQDSFTVTPPPLQTLKLYMPLTVGYFDDDSYGEEYTMSAGEAVQYAPQITRLWGSVLELPAIKSRSPKIRCIATLSEKAFLQH